MKIYALVLSLAVFSFACQTQTQPQEASTAPETKVENAPKLVNDALSVEEFKSLMAALSDIQLIDVRKPEEYDTGHIEGSLNLNFYDEDFDEQLQQLDSTKPIFVYCRSGKRSAKTATKLQALKFKQVFDLKGGFLAWSKE